MIRVTLPAITNESVTLVKDTALLYAVAVPEILHAARVAVNRDLRIIPLVLAGIIYLVMNSILSLFMQRLERKYKFE
jgi:polar amino acid transport system permease protein